jgi:hypothetical protein
MGFCAAALMTHSFFHEQDGGGLTPRAHASRDMAAEDNEGFTPRGHASRFMATLDEEAGSGVLPTWALVPGSRAACMSPAGGQIQRLASRHSAEGPAGCGSLGSPPSDSALASHRTNILSEVPQVSQLLDLCLCPLSPLC